MASSTPTPSQAQAELPVLIIGAGLAGLTVALHMAETQPVILMAKRGLGEAATAWAQGGIVGVVDKEHDSIDSHVCLLYTSPSPRDGLLSRMPSSA